jgi:thymidylate kinase
MRPSLLISFSGLDGAGKSTQIENLRATLQSLGYRTRLLSFWDNIVVLSRYREGFVHKVYGSERGVGEPGKPVARRDKNVRRWYLTLMRHSLYLLDALHLGWVVEREREHCDVLIMDRYIYDEVANLPLGNPLTRAYVRLLSAITPQPDIAYLLDADPDAAVARKPEYPVDFMRRCRASYFRLAALLPHFTVVPPLPLLEAKNAVVDAFLRHTTRRRAAPADTTETASAA